jgi:hypothetical protein
LVKGLRLRVHVSSDGESFQPLTTGAREPNGGFSFELPNVPHELLDAFERYVREFNPSVGSWKHKVAAIIYRIDFTNSL